MTATTPQKKTVLTLTSCRPQSVLTDDVRDIIAASMMDDPSWKQIAPKDPVRHELMLGLVVMSQRIAFSRGGWVWSAQDAERRTRAGLIWNPPGAYPMKVRDYFCGIANGLRMVVREPVVVSRTVRMGSGIERYFPSHPVAYASFVGAAPHLPRCGAGRFLLDAMAEECDRQGWDCFLETQNPANVSYYASLGYELIGHAEHSYPGGPPNWSMLRRYRLSG